VTGSRVTRLREVAHSIRRRPLFEVVRVDVIEREVDKPLPNLKPIPGAEIHRVGPARSEPWREFLPAKRWRIAEVGLSRGHETYFLMYEGELAARIVFTRTTWRDPASRLVYRVASNEAYSYGMEAYRPYRHLGVAAAVVAAMLTDLRAEGAERVYGAIDEHNRESQALMRIMFGFTQVQIAKRALLLRRIGWQVPGSDDPSFGPMSKVGHHSGATAPRAH
jgi:RimJ/RimL family protein N-acetyltransferase